MKRTRHSPEQIIAKLRMVVVVASLIVVFAAKTSGDASTEDGVFRVRAADRQLFLDDVGIARIENLERTMHQPAKKGAVIRPTPPLETALQTRSAPVWDHTEGLFKLWLITSSPIPDASGMTYVESRDGLHWSKPLLRQVEVNGSLDNNFITIEPGLKWPDNAIMNVVYDPDDPDPSRRYKGLAHCFRREPVVSPDGIHWKRLDVPALPSSDESNLSYDPQTRTFIATLKHGGPHGRSVHLSTSKDFENWTEQELIFHADDLDQELGRKNIEDRFADSTLQQPCYNDPKVYNVDVYNMAAFRYEGLHIGIRAMYHATGPVPNYPNTDGFDLLQLACSRDLRTWKRLGDRKPFIGPSRLDSGAYDLTQILPPSYPILRSGADSLSGQDELWFYYTGLKYRAGTTKYVGGYPNGESVPLPGFDPDMGAICLAVLRRDGFISLDATDANKEGMVITKLFALPGNKLCLNVDAQEGWIRVDVLDESGKSVATSDSLTGDHRRLEVKWDTGSIAEFRGKMVRLRFTLRDARFYSYWLE